MIAKVLQHPNITTGIIGLISLLFLHLSQYSTLYLVLFLIGYFGITALTVNTKSRSSLLILSTLSAVILTMRIPYLPWGDAWQDYAMIIRILHVGYPDFWASHEPALQALIAQPLMPTLLACITWITTVDPMTIQRWVVPIGGATAPVILWIFAKQSISKNSAIFGAILFLTCTPFLHWVTQPVRETLAIPILILALWIGDAILSKGGIKNYILLLGCILILTPLHTLTSQTLYISWFGLSLSRIVNISDPVKRCKTAIISWGILILSLLWSFGWLAVFNSPFSNHITNQVSNLSLIPISLPTIVMLLITILSIPYLILIIPTIYSKIIFKLLLWNRQIILFLQISGFVAFVIALFFISGYSSFKVSYPASMILFPLGIFLFAIIGLKDMIKRDTSHIIGWISALGFFFIVGLLKPALVGDPLRVLTYLFAPLCLIAGEGIQSIILRFPLLSVHKLILVTFSLFCTMSLIFTFPAPVLLGITPQPGHPLYDDRQYTISHPESEIEGILWLSENHEPGTIYTDTNIYYASMWLTQDGKLKSVKSPKRLNPNQFKPDENSYILISERMFTSAKFGEWLLKTPRPLTGQAHGLSLKH